MEITTETQFPLPPGAEVSLKCSAGFTLTGDTTVTCEEGTSFLFESAPVCQLGLYQAVNTYVTFKCTKVCISKTCYEAFALKLILTHVTKIKLNISNIICPNLQMNATDCQTYQIYKQNLSFLYLTIPW